MTAHEDDIGRAARIQGWVRGWDLWTHTSPVGIAWMVVCELGVAVWAIWASAAALAQGPPPAETWLVCGVLTAAITVHIVLTLLIEEKGRAARLGTEYIDDTGIWTVCAAVVLPAHMMLVLMLAIRLQRYCLAHKPPSRFLFSSAAILCSGLAANTIAHSADVARRPGEVVLTLAVLAAAAVYYLAQTIIIGVARGLRLSWNRRVPTGNHPDMSSRHARTIQDTAARIKWSVDRAVWVTIPVQAAVRPAGNELAMVLLCATVASHIIGSMIARAVRPSPWWSEIIGTTEENADFAVTLALGLIAALLLIDDAGLVALLVVVAVCWTRRGQQHLAAITDAHHDPLTRLLNRRGFDDRAITALTTTPHNAVLMFDLDHFKAVNDSHGHSNGDRVLCAFAATLRDHTRPYDLLCRHGGEEIIAVLVDITTTEALTIAERIRHAISELAVPATRPAGGTAYTITDLSVSVGVAIHPQDGTTLEDLTTAADHALYQAKINGRNQVCTTTPSLSTQPGPSPMRTTMIATGPPHQTHTRQQPQGRHA